MTKIRRYPALAALLAYLLLALSACQAVDENVSMVEITVTPRIQTPVSQTSSPLAPTVAIVASVAPSETSLPSATPSSAAVPTGVATPIPTLPPADALARLQELFKTNNGCELPCFWGITPGETDWQTAYSILKPVGARTTRRGLPTPFAIEVEFGEVGSEDWRYHYYEVEDGIVQSFGGRTSLTSIFSPASILQTYGAPAEVYLVAGSEFPLSGAIPFYVTLFYPQHKFWLLYGTNAVEEDGHYRGCFFDHNSPPPEGIDPSHAEFSAAPHLAVWSHEDIRNLSDGPKVALTFIGYEGHATLAEMTDLDVITFYETFSDPDTPLCLETPVELWREYWSGG